MNTAHGHLVSITRVYTENGCEVAEVALRGAVRSGEIDAFRDALEQAGHRSPFLLVHLGDLEYLCSTGLGSLLAQSRVQEKSNGWLRIVSPSPTVRMILSLSGVSDILTATDSSEAALKDMPKAA